MLSPGMNKLSGIKNGLAELASEITPHEVELDITDFTLDQSGNQEINLWINVNEEVLSVFTQRMRPHIDKLTPHQQDCYYMAVEILKTTDHKANQAALAWLYEIAESSPNSEIEKEITNLMGFCQIS
jgi:negative regulator of genetic competence, sporulation and motility